MSTTRTTTITTTQSSGYSFNAAYLKSVSGILKLSEIILGAVCVGLMAYYMHTQGQLYFLLMSTTFLIGTFILLLSCLVSFGTGGLISHTLYELLYHSFAFILYIIAAIVVIIQINEAGAIIAYYDPIMAAGIIGAFVAILYLASAAFSFKTYRGI